MTHYTNVKMRISEGQKANLREAFESNCKSITFRLTFSDLHGLDVIALNNSQLGRLVEAYEEKKGMTIRMSQRQLAYYTKAGLISFLTGTVLPALGFGALSGLASTKN